jgi:hypothetical protein
MDTGTSHFVNIDWAACYYRGYGLNKSDVKRKVATGEIHIGKPEVLPGEVAWVNVSEGRYFITEGCTPIAAAVPVANAKPARQHIAPEPLPGVPDYVKRGARHDWHTGNVSGDTSRSSNALESAPAFQALDDAMQAAIEGVRRQHAQTFLRELRTLLAPYNTSRHAITIDAAMGSCCLKIDARLFSEHDSGPARGVYLLLAEITQFLNWDWCAYLDGARLN